MNIDIKSIDFKLQETLIQHVQSKAERLSRVCRDGIRAELVLKRINTSDRQNKRCEIRVLIPGNDLLAGAIGASFEEAVAEAVELIQRRCSIRKSKRIDYRLHLL